MIYIYIKDNMTNYFFKRDNNNKIRVVQLNLNEHTDIQSNEKFYSITGETGVLNGKMVKRPLVTIEQGKVKRTVKEQAELQYNSLCNSYLDKGYKSQEELKIKDITDESEVDLKVPKQNTDAKGNLKPMLALSVDSLPKSKQNILDNKWYASTKLDGVRCLMYYKDKEVYTSSRGGKDYDTPTTYIRKNTFLNQFFNNNPNVVLDGELYIHGKPLSYISGIVRLQDLCEKHEELQYYVYDIVDETKTFQERLKILTELDKCMSLSSIIPNRVVVVNHESVSGKDAIVQLHNQYISEGYEGLVIRDPNEKYKCGARDKRMLKVKMFQDDEFEITGMTDGLREEDFVFNMKTKDGYPFEAKPMGDRTLKKWYRENIDKLIGQMGTVKYFGYTATENAVPNLPVFKSLRDKTDL